MKKISVMLIVIMMLVFTIVANGCGFYYADPSGGQVMDENQKMLEELREQSE